MENVIVSLLSGGFAGAGVVALLSKLLLKNILEKDLKKFQHQLDIQKDRIQSDLMLYANQHKISYSVYDEKRRQAIEKVYTGIMNSIPMRGKLELKLNPSTKESLSDGDCTKLYVEDFVSMKRFLEEGINRVIQVQIDLNDVSIYFSQELEDLINENLVEIGRAYSIATHHINSFDATLSDLLAKHALTPQNEPLDLDQSYTTTCLSCLALTADVRKRLKDTLRHILTPRVYEEP